MGACARKGAPAANQVPLATLTDDQPGFDSWAALASPLPQAEWRQLAGPQVLPSGVAYAGPVLRFRTAPPPPSVGEFGPRALQPDEIPQYRFAVSAPGYPAQTLSLSLAHAQAGWPRAVLGEDRYLDCGDPGERVVWFLAIKPPRSKAKIEPPTSCVARFRPDVRGRYQVKDLMSGREIEIRAGALEGDTECGRPDCHPQLAAEVRQTAHAGACVRCHGTGFFYTSYDVGVCAPCHANEAQRLRRAAIADRSWSDPRLRAAACAGCHTAAAFRGYALTGQASLRPQTPGVRDVRLGSPHACATCHASHEGGARQGACEVCHLPDERSKGLESDGAVPGVRGCLDCHDPHGLEAVPSGGPCPRRSPHAGDARLAKGQTETPAPEEPKGR